VLSTAQFTTSTHSGYFSAHGDLRKDLFLDPDTGVATARPGPEHVTPTEIFALLTGENVVATYQHRPSASALVGS